MRIGKLELKEHCDIRAAMCEINPAQAAELLTRNTHNRKIRHGVVEKYVREIKNGEWFPSASGIGFDGTGTLVDGQHRLKAIVDSNTSATLCCVIGLPRAVQEKVDRQAKRSLVDCFTLSGLVTAGAPEVSLGTCLARIVLGGTVGRNVDIADVDVKEALSNHRPAIDFVLFNMRPAIGTKGLARAGVLAALVNATEINKTKTLSFIEKFLSGENMTNDNPPMRLRKYFLSITGYHSGGSAQMDDYERSCYALKAWFDGRNINSVRLGTRL